MAEATTHLDGRVRHVESEVSSLKVQVRDLDAKIADGFTRVFGKLDEMGRTQAVIQAQRPQSWDKVIGIVKDVVYLFAAVCAGIIYVSRGISHDDTAPLREDLAVIKRQLSGVVPQGGWTPQVTTPHGARRP